LIARKIGELFVGGPVLKLAKKNMPQMPFLELYHVYIYYMTSHAQFGGKIPPTALVIWLTVALQKL
jgi:hypothetical protein